MNQTNCFLFGKHLIYELFAKYKRRFSIAQVKDKIKKSPKSSISCELYKSIHAVVSPEVRDLVFFPNILHLSSCLHFGFVTLFLLAVSTFKMQKLHSSNHSETNMKKSFLFVAILILLSAESYAQSALLPQVRSVELSKAELATLGIVATTNTAEYREIRNGEEKRVVVKNEIFELKNLGKKDTRRNPECSPRLGVIADEHGSAAYFHDLNDYLSAGKRDSSAAALSNVYALANELISVHFTLQSKSVKKKNTEKIDVYLWYEPTQSFIDKLPDRYKVQIQEEKTNPKPDEPSFRQTNKTYSFVLSLYPNPATSDVVTLRIASERALTANIIISDISGNRTEAIQRTEQIGEGETNVALSIRDLTPGMYIVTVQTPDGEQISERLIVLH